jgi:copper chaperone
MITLQVKGMNCDGCIRALTRRIHAVAPEATVRIDLETGQVEIDGPIDPVQAVEAVDEAGFSVAATPA